LTATILLAGLEALAAAGQAAPKGGGRPIAEVLRERVEQIQAADAAGAGRAELAARRVLPEIYEKAGYQPFWTAERLQTLTDLVRESADDGLRLGDYHSRRAREDRRLLSAPTLDAESRARADLLATDAFFLLLFHLYFGRVDPKSLDPVWNFESRKIGEKRGRCLRARSPLEGPAARGRRQSAPAALVVREGAGSPRRIPRTGGARRLGGDPGRADDENRREE
jgi:hypothetical protein